MLHTRNVEKAQITEYDFFPQNNCIAMYFFKFFSESGFGESGLNQETWRGIAGLGAFGITVRYDV